MDVEEKLRNETEKWLKKAEIERREIKSDSQYLKNIDAYISDAKHFLKKNDLINAFEAVVWAFAWIEILEELGVIRKA